MSDIRTMSARSLRLTARNTEAGLTALMLPIMLMLMFVYLFGGAIQTGAAYVQYVVPGVLILCVGFGSSITAVSVTSDMKNGIADRFRSMDVNGAAVLGGHVVASIARNAISTMLVFGVALLVGFRSGADLFGWFGAAGILLAYAVAVSWLSAAMGLLFTSPEGASGFTFFAMFLPYASSAFVPVDTMPTWVQGFAQHQPSTPVIESLRALLLGTSTGSSPSLALAWSGGILVVALVLTRLLYRRRNASG